MNLSISSLLLLLISIGFKTDGAVVWKNTTYDFGTVKQGEVLQTQFVCYNKSDSVLRIENVSSPCSCTTPNYKKDPIYPGDSAVVDVQFTTEGKNGRQNKYFGVYTNQGLYDLHISAFVRK